MSAFKFRLQPVYDLRSQMEKEQKDRFAQQVQKLNKLLEYGEYLENEHRVWSQKYMDSAIKGISALQAVRIMNYLDELKNLLEKNRTDIAEQEKQVESARLLLIEKIRERKVIEALKEKQYQRFKEDEQKKQEKEVEEIISYRIR